MVARYPVGMRAVCWAVWSVVAACSFDGGVAIDGGGGGRDGAGADATVGPRADAGVDAGPSDPDANVDAAAAPADAPVMAVSCPPTFQPINGARPDQLYLGVDSSKTWEQAEAHCRDQEMVGGSGRTHLVVLDDDLERSAVFARFGSTRRWIGLTDRIDDDQFRWVTIQGTGGYPGNSGGPWGPNEPRNGLGDSEDCVWMSAQMGQLADDSCEQNEQFVCECDAFAEDPTRF